MAYMSSKRGGSLSRTAHLYLGSSASPTSSFAASSSAGASTFRSFHRITNLSAFPSSSSSSPSSSSAAAASATTAAALHHHDHNHNHNYNQARVCNNSTLPSSGPPSLVDTAAAADATSHVFGASACSVRTEQELIALLRGGGPAFDQSFPFSAASASCSLDPFSDAAASPTCGAALGAPPMEPWEHDSLLEKADEVLARLQLAEVLEARGLPAGADSASATDEESLSSRSGPEGTVTQLPNRPGGRGAGSAYGAEAQGHVAGGPSALLASSSSSSAPAATSPEVDSKEAHVPGAESVDKTPSSTSQREGSVLPPHAACGGDPALSMLWDSEGDLDSDEDLDEDDDNLLEGPDGSDGLEDCEVGALSTLGSTPRQEAGQEGGPAGLERERDRWAADGPDNAGDAEGTEARGEDAAEHAVQVGDGRAGRANPGARRAEVLASTATSCSSRQGGTTEVVAEQDSDPGQTSVESDQPDISSSSSRSAAARTAESSDAAGPSEAHRASPRCCSEFSPDRNAPAPSNDEAEGESSVTNAATGSVSGTSHTFEDQCERLTRDVQTFMGFVDRRHEAGALHRRRTMQLVLEVVGTVFPHTKLEEYGSTKYRLALPGSDLDLVMIVPGKNAFNFSRDVMKDSLARVAFELEQQSWVSSLVCITTAAMPVVKFTSAVGNLHVDLTCMGSMHQGIRTQSFVSETVQRRPRVRPLVLFLKQLLREHELADHFRGGLSSYGAFLFVVCFDLWIDAAYGPEVRPNLGWILLAFLQHHCVLDYATVVFTAGGYRPRTPMEILREPVLVEDPFDPSRNVAHGMYRLSDFRTVVARAWQAIQTQPLDAVLSLPFRRPECGSPPIVPSVPLAAPVRQPMARGDLDSAAPASSMVVDGAINVTENGKDKPRSGSASPRISRASDAMRTGNASWATSTMNDDGSAIIELR